MGSAAEKTITPVIVTDDEAYLFAMQLASCSVLPMVLQAALELDLFEVMAKNVSQMSPAEITFHLPTKNTEAPLILDRILRLLAAYSILTCSVRTLQDGDSVERLYGLGPVCKYLIKNEDGVSIAPLCLMTQDKVFMQSWYHLKDAILDGGTPFNKACGMSVLEYKRTDSRFNKVVNNGMSNYSTISIKKILEIYKGFDGLTSLVDVGGGTGATFQMIVSKYPYLKCINFDLPHVIKDIAPPHPGIEHVGGDMFVSVPKGDAMFMKWICHTWSDEQCFKFLKNCYDSLPENGKVIVAECIMAETLDSSLMTKEAVHVDCVMLAHTSHSHGGIERTEKEFEALAKGSGFHSIKVVCNAFGLHIIEFLKKI